ncbi:MAG: Rieske 2Fe-2S domain-containing protein [Phycisphaerales bacterium]|nr:Rieske 2Fe-2S domain-containing protein [Phycisphaerales bacterium]
MTDAHQQHDMQGKEQGQDAQSSPLPKRVTAPLPGKDTATSLTRRGFMLALGYVLMAISVIAVGIPIVWYVISVFRTYPDKWVKLSDDINRDFPEGSTRLADFINPANFPDTGPTKEARTENSAIIPWQGASIHLPCWVRRIKDEQFQIFAINCSHLGCPVRWFDEAELFMCPCHGSVFYQDGEYAAGPAPRGLYQYRFKITDARDKKGEARKDNSGNQPRELWIKAGTVPTLQQPA